jgi:cytochrome P450
MTGRAVRAKFHRNHSLAVESIISYPTIEGVNHIGLSPAKSIRRVTARDVNHSGKFIEAKEMVTTKISPVSHNLDGFDSPVKYRPARHPNRHIAFGKRIHYCLGTPLAHVETDITLKALLDWFAVLELMDTAKDPVPSQVLYGTTESAGHVEANA